VHHEKHQQQVFPHIIVFIIPALAQLKLMGLMAQGMGGT